MRAPIFRVSNSSFRLISFHIFCRNIIDEVGGHPALLMWVLGNEIVLHEPEKLALKQRINQKMDFARRYTLQKHNRVVPITSCVVDLPESYDFLVNNLNVDLFCANAGYRADSLTDLFTGNVARSTHLVSFS